MKCGVAMIEEVSRGLRCIRGGVVVESLSPPLSPPQIPFFQKLGNWCGDCFFFARTMQNMATGFQLLLSHNLKPGCAGMDYGV